MNVTHGMDLAAVEELGRFLQAKSDAIRTLAADLDTMIHRTGWTGDDSGHFREQQWPNHRSRLQLMAEQIHGFGQSALNNASEQRDASNVGSTAESRAKSSAAAYAVHTETYARVVKSGVIGKGVDGSEITLMEMSDGTWRVRVGFDSSFELSVGDALDVASLGAPQMKALSTLAGALGGSASMFGFGKDWEFQVSDEAAARRLAEALRREADEVGGMDNISQSEIWDVVKAERANGEVVWIDYERSSEAGSFDGTIGHRGFELEGGYSKPSTSHGVEMTEHGAVTTDSVRQVGLSGGGGLHGATVDYAGAKEIVVHRNSSGEVVSVTVTTTAAPTGAVDLSSSTVVEALVDKGTKQAIGGLGNITGLVNSHGGVSTGVVVETSTTYDLMAPENAALRAQLGCTDTSSSMSASQIQDVFTKVEGSNAVGSRTVEVSQVNTQSDGFRAISYETDTHRAESTVLSRNTYPVR